MAAILQARHKKLQDAQAGKLWSTDRVSFSFLDNLLTGSTSIQSFFKRPTHVPIPSEG